MSLRPGSVVPSRTPRFHPTGFYGVAGFTYCYWQGSTHITRDDLCFYTQSQAQEAHDEYIARIVVQ